jgi:hypothetical protein
MAGKQVVYRVDAISAVGQNPGVIKAAHRAMIVAAAQLAQKHGLATFKMLGKQGNANFVRHADQLARAAGQSGSGRAITGGLGFPDYEVILNVNSVLSRNTP